MTDDPDAGERDHVRVGIGLAIDPVGAGAEGDEEGDGGAEDVPRIAVGLEGVEIDEKDPADARDRGEPRVSGHALAEKRAAHGCAEEWSGGYAMARTEAMYVMLAATMKATFWNM